MGNGAQFHRVNWMGNPGLPGLRASAGMMVNYLYDLPALDVNAGMFKHPVGEGQVDGSGKQEALQLALGDSVRAILSRR
jgi:hypothetical protein